MNKRLQGTLILALTAIIWGISFVSQSVGMEVIEPNTFNGIRTLLGCVSLLPIIAVRGATIKRDATEQELKDEKKNLIKGGIACGIFLCLASTVQTYGLKFTTAGKSGFITAMYMIIVPIISVFLGKKIRPMVFAGVAVALTGLYFLCLGGGGGAMNRGDAITLVCALLFAFHILTVDHFSPKVDGVKLSCLQFLVAGTLNIIAMFIFEKPVMADIMKCTVPILYSGLMSCGVAYTLQIIGQKYAEPTVASIVMSMESVFSALAGWVILGQGMSGKELFGCVLAFGAIVLVQLPERKMQTDN